LDTRGAAPAIHTTGAVRQSQDPDASLQGTFVGQQFDDDLNSLLLKKFFTVDLYLGRSLGHGVEVFAAAENMFNRRITRL